MKLKKADLILILAGIILAAAGGLYYFVTRQEGAEVIVTVNQQETARFPLDQDTEYDIVSEEGHNLLVIKDGIAKVTDADCPDKICVKDYSEGIHYNGQTIVCLPHKVVVSIDGGEEREDDLDAMVGR